jgi:hypothetical protein
MWVEQAIERVALGRVRGHCWTELLAWDLGESVAATASVDRIGAPLGSGRG